VYWAVSGSTFDSIISLLFATAIAVACDICTIGVSLGGQPPDLVNHCAWVSLGGQPPDLVNQYISS
jgi:hypothetical protein